MKSLSSVYGAVVKVQPCFSAPSRPTGRTFFSTKQQGFSVRRHRFIVRLRVCSNLQAFGTRLHHSFRVRQHSFPAKPDCFGVRLHRFCVLPHIFGVRPHSFAIQPHFFVVRPHRFGLRPQFCLALWHFSAVCHRAGRQRQAAGRPSYAVGRRSHAAGCPRPVADRPGSDAGALVMLADCRSNGADRS